MKKEGISSHFESIFCIVYLIYVYSCAVVFFSQNTPLSYQFGWLALVLGVGDSFHLVPRILKDFSGESSRLEWWTGLGLMVSSITMTLFYLLLFGIWKTLFSQIRLPAIISWVLYISAALRIVLCFSKNNNWFSPEGNQKWGIYRNIPFVIVGIIMVVLFLITDNLYGYGMWRMGVAIFLSFACYLPVVLYAKRRPIVGMLMIPKTLCYMYMLFLGLMLILSN